MSQSRFSPEPGSQTLPASVGRPLAWSERAVTLSTSPTQILGGDQRRVSVILANNSAINVFVGKDGNVSSTMGILVPPNGGTLSFNFVEDGEATTWPMMAIAASGTPTLFIKEGTSN